jgi:nitrous oxidase accessory protein NosD
MAVYNVTNAAGLQSALSLAIGGDRIVLAPGNYGSVSIQGRHYATPVTLQTSTLADRAHLDGISISNSSNLTISGLDLGRALNEGEVAKSTHLNSVRHSTNIRFTGVQIHGSRDGDPSNDGSGLLVSDTSGFRIDGSKLSDLFRGINVQRSSNTMVLSNAFDTIRSDGMTVASANSILIDRNSFTNFKPIAGDHSDAIQFWNTGQTVGSSNVTIRSNVIAPGSDDYVTQGIWISDPGTLGYKNVKILNNLVYSHGAYHGISVYGAAGLQVANNTVLSQSNDSKKLWIQLNNSSSVSLTGNVSDLITLNNVSNLTQSNNKNLQAEPGFRTILSDVNTPDTLMDLIVPGVGFQAPTASAALKTLTVSADPYFGSPAPAMTQAWLLDSFTALP